MSCSYLSPDHPLPSLRVLCPLDPTRPHDRPSHMICFGKAKHVGPNERRQARYAVRQRRLDQPGCADVSDDDIVNLHLGWAWYSSPPIYIYIYMVIYICIYIWNIVELDQCVYLNDLLICFIYMT